MNFPIHKIRLETVWPDNDGYFDAEFTDVGKNSIRRLWRLSREHNTNNWYSTLSRSETDDGAFESCVELPPKITNALVDLLWSSSVW